MSLIIKGLDMPKTCYLCTFRIIDPTDGSVSGCVVGHIEKMPLDQDRADDCPLIQIPKGHGRLIDERELSDRLLDIPHYTVNIHQVPTGVFRDADVLPEVRHSPTILEAED